MKKRILALALAATTAFSMFGASLSVSAAEAESTKVNAIITGEYADDEGYADYASFIDEMEAVQALIVEDEDETVDAKHIYSYDYNSTSWNAFTSALDAALEVTSSSDKIYVNMYKNAAEAVKTAAANLALDLESGYKATALRTSLLKSYDSAKAALAKVKAEDYDKDTQAELTKVQALFTAENAQAMANSAIVSAVAAYETFVENAGLADIDDKLYDAIDALIEKAEKVLEYRDEYKTTAAADKAFATLEKKLDAAYEVSGDYSVTNSKLTTVKNELEAALNNVARYGTAAKKATWDALQAAIKKADACVADAGYTTSGDSEAAKTFNAALTAAKAVKSTDTEHVVSDATDALLDAIDGLKVTAAKGSEVLAAQETLEDAGVFDLVESDYTAASWKKFDAAMADYEAAVTTKELTTAVAKAEKADPKTVSQYEAQISALTAAIDAYKNNKVVDAYEGWAYDNGTWYFYVKGEKATGWTWDGKNWYYMNDKGVMQTGWQKIDGAWYYLNTWGGMAKGWAKVNNTWYYLNPNGGKMVANGWNWINGKCYYFYASGALAVSTTIDGYTVDANGAWVK